MALIKRAIQFLREHSAEISETSSALTDFFVTHKHEVEPYTHAMGIPFSSIQRNLSTASMTDFFSTLPKRKEDDQGLRGLLSLLENRHGDTRRGLSQGVVPLSAKSRDQNDSTLQLTPSKESRLESHDFSRDPEKSSQKRDSAILESRDQIDAASARPLKPVSSDVELGENSGDRKIGSCDFSEPHDLADSALGSPIKARALKPRTTSWSESEDDEEGLSFTPKRMSQQQLAPKFLELTNQTPRSVSSPLAREVVSGDSSPSSSSPSIKRTKSLTNTSSLSLQAKLLDFLAEPFQDREMVRSRTMLDVSSAPAEATQSFLRAKSGSLDSPIVDSKSSDFSGISGDSSKTISDVAKSSETKSGDISRYRTATDTGTSPLESASSEDGTRDFSDSREGPEKSLSALSSAVDHSGSLSDSETQVFDTEKTSRDQKSRVLGNLSGASVSSSALHRTPSWLPSNAELQGPTTLTLGSRGSSTGLGLLSGTMARYSATQVVVTTSDSAPYEIRAVNDVACLVFGVSRAELRNTSILEMARDDFRADLEFELKKGHVISGMVIPVVKGNRQESLASIWVKPSANALIWVAEEVAGDHVELGMRPGSRVVETIGGDRNILFGQHDWASYGDVQLEMLLRFPRDISEGSRDDLRTPGKNSGTSGDSGDGSGVAADATSTPGTDSTGKAATSGTSKTASPDSNNHVSASSDVAGSSGASTESSSLSSHPDTTANAAGERTREATASGTSPIASPGSSAPAHTPSEVAIPSGAVSGASALGAAFSESSTSRPRANSAHSAVPGRVSESRDVVSKSHDHHSVSRDLSRSTPGLPSTPKTPTSSHVKSHDHHAHHVLHRPSGAPGVVPSPSAKSAKPAQVSYAYTTKAGPYDYPCIVRHVTNSFHITSLPHMSGMVMVDSATLRITDYNAFFVQYLFGYDAQTKSLVGESIGVLLPQFPGFVEEIGRGNFYGAKPDSSSAKSDSSSAKAQTMGAKDAKADTSNAKADSSNAKTRDTPKLSNSSHFAIGMVYPEHFFRRMASSGEDKRMTFFSSIGIDGLHSNGAVLKIDVQLRVASQSRFSLWISFSRHIQEAHEIFSIPSQLPLRRVESEEEGGYSSGSSTSLASHSRDSSVGDTDTSVGESKDGFGHVTKSGGAKTASQISVSDLKKVKSRDSAISESGNASSSTLSASEITQLRHVTEIGSQKRSRKFSEFKILKKMGEGAYGRVVLARYPDEPACLIVVKSVVKDRILVDTWVRDRKLGTVSSEIKILAALNQTPHPNIVGMVDFLEDDECYHIEMEAHGNPGIDLFDLIELNPQMPEDEAKSIFRQIVSAVAHLHGLGIVHRDIKDENIILDGKGLLKLIDFGSAAYVKNGPFDVFVGTIDYAAPEVLSGNPYLGRPQDVWALGILLYTIVYKENPFYNVDEILEGELRVPFVMSEDCLDLIKMILNRDVNKRPTVEEIQAHRWLQ
ncbi:Serine/threonine-protein kinase PSK1 [Yarrowia sp. B02]|nr:Serine/threonine-protein kinase PSK1 [Yarrowia sp. B02]